MGIKTFNVLVCYCFVPLKNLPTTWGLRLLKHLLLPLLLNSEKPPHHMGIKTFGFCSFFQICFPLKNLPTTWGLRHSVAPTHIRGTL